ncbi:MAG: glucosaminidase domain-containing protein [Alphaproteobacteria bacterium]|nr:glucosaminidase domain-containing protein [Alphaproteobacteria bacterium]MBV8407188.1 glucosaminidase domain-containing protein [Alphaproteobacteria bacterium]
MQLAVWPAARRGRDYSFAIVWGAVLAGGLALSEPLPSFEVAPYLSFAPTAPAEAAPQASALPELYAAPEVLAFVRHEMSEPDDMVYRSPREQAWAHGRFAAPGNAVRRQVQLRTITPKTADELAGFFRRASYSLGDIRQGEAVPPIRLEKIPSDITSKDGNERKALFITALLPVILEVNQHILADREQLMYLREKFRTRPASVTTIERIWLEELAERYDTPFDNLDELLRRVDIVPPSMAIAQGGVESGWGSSPAARGNSLFGQLQVVGRSGTAPQPFANLGEATAAYIANLNTHRAYVAFRTARAALRERGEALDGYQLIGALLRYSELGTDYVRFVRQIMRENDLADFDKARLSIY